jgi:hypothetical protein
VGQNQNRFCGLPPKALLTIQVHLLNYGPCRTFAAISVLFDRKRTKCKNPSADKEKGVV